MFNSIAVLFKLVWGTKLASIPDTLSVCEQFFELAGIAAENLRLGLATLCDDLDIYKSAHVSPQCATIVTVGTG